MALPGDLTTATITGQFVSTSGAPVIGTITFSPTSTLLDPTSQMVIPATGSTYPLSSMGTFTSDPLISTDNTDLEPQGWAYNVKVELQDLQPYTFTCFLPSSPSTVDLSALEPVFPAGTTLGPPGNYLPAGGGTETGTLVLGGPIPLKVPGATAGQTLVSDASGNFTPQANPAGAATSIDGVSVTGITAAGRVIMAVDSANATWQLPLQIDTTDGDIEPLAATASASVGGLTQAAAVDHQHPSTGLVDTSSTQSIAGTKTFSGEIIVPTPSAAGDAATKAYVDASAQGLSVKLAVQEATTAALSPANTYSNGSSGVGATLTATGNGTLTVDGQTVALNDRVLVKNEATAANNGIYACTTQGTGSVPYVLTRATDMDQAAEIPGAFAFVVNGTQAGDSFAVTAGGPYTVGTTAINWTLFSSPAQVTAGNAGISVAGSAVSLVTPVAIASGGTGTVSSSVFNVRAAAYGATGNGSTVDTTAVQAAVAAALAAGGGEVYFPAGTYVMSGVTFGSNLTVRGAGMGNTILKMDPAASSGSVVCRVAPASSSVHTSNMILRDLTIDGNKSAWGDSSTQKGYGFYCGQSPTNGLITHCKIINVEIHDCMTYAFDVERVQWVTLIGCDAHDNGYTTGTGTQHNADGFTLIGDDITAIDCRAWNNAVQGFRGGQSGSVWHRVQLAGCEAWGNGSHGAGLGSDTTPPDALYSSAVTGGAFYSNGGAGIYLNNNAVGCAVTGASVYNNATNGILLSAASWCSVTGCTVKDNATAGSSNPEIYLTSTSVNNAVTGNSVTSSTATHAISEQAGGTTDSNLIAGNQVASTSATVVVSGADTIAYGNQGSPVAVGLDLPAASTTVQGAIELGGGTTNFLRADGTWAAPPGGGATIDTTDSPQALGSASAGTSTNGASAWNHVHPTTGLLTTSAPVDPGHGGTGVNAASGSDALVQMAGSTGAPALGKYLRGNGSAIQLTNIAATDLPTATTGAQGAVTLDGPAATDIAASPGTAAAGAIGKAADSGHVHGQPPMFAPTGLTGATSPSRYVGATTSGAPASGTFAVGDFTVDRTGSFWICTTAGTVGSGAVFSHLAGGTGLTNVMSAVGDTIYGGTVVSGTATATRLAGNTAATPKVLTQTGNGTISAAPVWTAPSPDWLNVVTQFGADNTGATNAQPAIQNAINAAPLGGTVYFPAGTYSLNAPLIVRPTISLQGSGRSLAYNSGSQVMTISTPVLKPSSSFAAVQLGGQWVQGVIAFISENLGTAASLTGYTSGSSNQTVRYITINGTGGAAANGIEAWGAVWAVKLEDVGIFHMVSGAANQHGTTGGSPYEATGWGIYTNSCRNGATGDTSGSFPDFWQLIGVHVAACGNHANGAGGIAMYAIGDSYFIGCESTGNQGNGWQLTGDNIKIVACKAEYNNGIGLSMAKSTSSRPNLISDFGTDGNYQHGIQLSTSGAGLGPFVLTGIGLNYDGWDNNSGLTYAGVNLLGGVHATITGLHVTTSKLSSTAVCPTYAIQTSTTFTGAVQVDQSELYGGTRALNLSAASGATGTVTFGPNVITGSGGFDNAQGETASLANIAKAPSPQTDLQQYAKYWSPTAGAGGDWVTSTTQQPRESMPWYAVSGNPTIASGQMLCAAIPVMPGDTISKLGFIVGATPASLTAGGAGPHWWVALYTAGGVSLIGQSADQGAATLLANTPHLLSLTAASGFTIPYLVPAGVYSLLGVVMVNSNGGTQPSLRGISQQAVLNGGAGDLFAGSTVYAATVGAAGSNGGATPPAGPLTLSVATSFAYMGAC